MTKILISWIGLTDLRAADEDGKNGLGPVGAVLAGGGYDLAALTWHESERFLREAAGPYEAWLRARLPPTTDLEAHEVKLDNPINFRQIYEAVLPVVEKVTDHAADPPVLTYHLSAGTPAMAVVWILLASSRYPGHLIQASKERGIEEAQLPFDIAATFVPDLVRTSRQIQDITAGLPPAGKVFDNIIHRSAVMKDLLARARIAAAREVPVLIEGETGTGKELLANAIHGASPRVAGPFVPVNCGAIPEGLVESELFGHRKGAFTGATADRPGVFEQADGGTVFLDEIGELPLQMQVKLLRVLQEGQVQRLGDTDRRTVDFRVVAATNRNLIDEARGGRFRHDLFYRLAVAVVRVPPLRERVVDIPLLVDHFINEVNEEQRSLVASWADRSLSAGAMKALREHRWPGNIRELRNTLSRAAIWSAGESLSKDDVQTALLPSVETGTDGLLNRPLGNGLDVNQLVDQLKAHYVVRALRESGGVKTTAAKLIGLANSTTLSNWIKALAIAAAD